MSPESLQDLLHNAASNGIYHVPPAGRDALAKTAVAGGLCYHLCQLDDSEEIDDVLELLGEGLHFPKWYGKNFDALYDCLTDLTWQDTAASVIVLTGCDAIYAADPESWQTLVSVLRSAAEFWQNEDVPFWVFIDMSADGLASSPAFG
jgi:RNAse (barnase) inhibitor barstar